MQIHFYTKGSGKRPVQEFIDSLSKEDQSRIDECLADIRKEGLNSKACIFKYLKSKLWEIKKKGRDGTYRILYVIVQLDIMVLLHAFKKKSRKTPKKDLAIGIKRKKEVLGE